MTQIVECIPNFSEGQRPEVVDAIVAAIASVDDVRVLHRNTDPDHNRSVITFIGTPEAIVNGAYLGIKTAAKHINLEQHHGVHPRIGAADVVPFVPIEGVTMDDCVHLARKLGQRVGDELGLPVYLYEYAALRPERRSLPDIRRGQYEGLKDSIQTAERYPDYGPAQLGTAGAVVIGARKPLIAYNVYLNTTDVTVAERIARTIRESSGGLVGVRALGLLVKGRAQVSMNLLDYKRTPVHQVVETIRRETARYGTMIIESELIGLIPQDAVFASAAWYLQLHDFSNRNVLEYLLKT